MTQQSSTPAPNSPVTVIGLGPMGLALAETLMKNGHPTTVWNRTPGKARNLVAGGARLAASVADAVAASPLTVVCLKDYATLYEVFGSAAGAAAAGRALVNLNSGTPKEAHAAASWAAARGVAYLDGAIMVPPPLVGEPGAAFLYSGPREVFAAHRDTLARLGDPRHLGSDPGLAVLHNAALLGLMYATMNGFLHAAALVGSAGVPAAEFAELAVNRFLPTVVDATLVAQAPDLDAGHYPGGLGTMEMNLNALEHIALTCEEQGVHAGQPLLMRDIAAQAIRDGHGASNYLAVFEVFKKEAAPGAR
ncbi:NAD(P)-dependent oxidoreductase [Streptomyces durocortorensis]|uniref:NAD(P)-dependent oxidoreductase n=1 Tax=Streptomyces durocortorensis TaxID=2811104 RepID=A0ABS2I6U3_9ACTN|nr:NAD(P)-binding domain-containing protein [Streptomyces durocortorensis]MBM7058378.1 NAD(P)-dependent oxidoreductase [Streptomyces durocortorensis]